MPNPDFFPPPKVSTILVIENSFKYFKQPNWENVSHVDIRQKKISKRII